MLAHARLHSIVGLSILAATLPTSASAAVLINEIAWMGSAANANAEWIELANTGADPVDLTDWRLTSSTGSPSITLSGSIAPGGYYLLERTGDDTVPGIAADYLYTGALSNSGATLALTDASGATADQVAGGENWEAIGGDNTTKETAQRTAAGWITASATPRAENAASGGGTAATSTPSGASASPYVPPAPFSIDIGADRTLLRDVPTTFSATVKGSTGDAMPAITWSFGDGGSSSGSSPVKTYRYPGTYLVVARAGEEPFMAEASVVVEVVAAPVRLAAIGPDGITVANDGTRRLDLSGWRLTTDLGFFRVPPGTTLLPGAATLFPWAVTGLPVAAAATLAFPDGTYAAGIAPTEPALAASPAAPELMQPAPSTHGSSLVQTVETAFTNFPKTALAMKHQAPGTAEQAAVSGVASATVLDLQDPPAHAGGSWRASPWFLAVVGVAAAVGGALMIL